LCCRRRLGTTPTRASAKSCMLRVPAAPPALMIAARTSHCPQPEQLTAAVVHSLRTTSNPAHGTRFSRPTLLAKRFWGWFWRRSFLEFTIGLFGLFRARPGSLVPRQTISMGSSRPCVLGFAPLATTAQHTQRQNRSHARKVTIVQKVLALRCLARRARILLLRVSRALPSARRPKRASTHRRAAPSRRRVLLERR
jgi:hypothetical protein